MRYRVLGEGQRLSTLASRDLAALPPGLRPAIEAKVTDWSGHRLFGRFDDLPHNHEDRQGQDLLICLHADPLIGTGMDHDFGLSVWCPHDDLARGIHDMGQIIHHDGG